MTTINETEPKVYFCDGVVCVTIGFKQFYFDLDGADSTGAKLDKIPWREISDGAQEYFTGAF